MKQQGLFKEYAQFVFSVEFEMDCYKFMVTMDMPVVQGNIVHRLE